MQKNAFIQINTVHSYLCYSAIHPVLKQRNPSHLITYGPRLLTLGKVALYINYTLGDFQEVILLYSDLIREISL